MASARASLEDQISEIAYGLWEAEGRPDGREKEHWFMAEDIVARRAVPSGEDDDAKEGYSHVRPAGDEQMDMPPATWTPTDEESDESFPVSDPPANY